MYTFSALKAVFEYDLYLNIPQTASRTQAMHGKDRKDYSVLACH